jgi:hypothetical protein
MQNYAPSFFICVGLVADMLADMVAGMLADMVPRVLNVSAGGGMVWYGMMVGIREV